MKTYTVHWVTRRGRSLRKHRHEFQAPNATAARMIFLQWREQNKLKAEPQDIRVELCREVTAE